MVLPEDLGAREILVFVGKGGVGKTTTSSAIAMQLADEGRRTLLVTVDPAKRLKDALATDIGHRPTQVRPKLWAMMMDPEKVIEEFVREHAPDRNLAEHPMYKYISNYLPGINEMLAIGKLIEFRQEKDFDCIVVDTAPTGHALSFLSSPMAIRDVFQENLLLRWALRGYGIYQRVAKSGRMLSGIFGGKDKVPEPPDIDMEALFEEISQQVGQIHALLSDDKRTTLVIVTLPEKLPVEETIDLHAYVTDRLSMHVGYIVVNKVQPDALGRVTADFDRLRGDQKARAAVAASLKSSGYPPELEASLVESTEFNEVRRAMNMAHTKDLAERLPQVPRVLLPLHRRDISGLDRLAALQAEFVRGLTAGQND